MKVSEMFPSKYMKAETDFAEGETKILTIRNIEAEEMGKEKELKPVIYFREPGNKPLVLNKTNAAIISKFYSDEMDEWIGKKVALHVMEVSSFGDVVQAIRVKTKQPQAAPKPAPQQTEGDLFDDDIPGMNLPAGDVVTRNRQPA